MHKHRLILAALAAGASPAAGQFLGVGGQLQATARVLSNAQNAFLPVVPPGPGSNQASVGMVTSAVGYEFFESPGQYRLDLTWDHTSAYPVGGGTAFTYSDAHFSVPPGARYTISGLFSVPPGQPLTPLTIDLSILVPGGGTIFHHAATRAVAGGSSLVIGIPVPGDVFTGSPTGTLASGTVYTIGLDASSGGLGPQGEPILASGVLHIQLDFPGCYPNCDGSTIAPILNINDFTCFLNRFAAGDTYANCDGSTAPPLLNVNDFLCFQNRFSTGCQ